MEHFTGVRHNSLNSLDFQIPRSPDMNRLRRTIFQEEIRPEFPEIEDFLLNFEEEDNVRSRSSQYTRNMSMQMMRVLLFSQHAREIQRELERQHEERSNRRAQEVLRKLHDQARIISRLQEDIGAVRRRLEQTETSSVGSIIVRVIIPLWRRIRERRERESKREREERRRRIVEELSRLREEEAERRQRVEAERMWLNDTGRSTTASGNLYSWWEVLVWPSEERERIQARERGRAKRRREARRQRESVAARRRQEAEIRPPSFLNTLTRHLRSILCFVGGHTSSTPTNLSQSQVNQIPCTQHRSNGTNTFITTPEVQCSICLSHCRDGEMKRVLPCKHKFHRLCVDRWLLIRATCPVCRQRVAISS